MSSMKGLLETCPLAAGLPPANRFRGPAMSILRALIVALLVALVGCAARERPPVAPPPVVIAQSTWRQVDRDIFVASQEASGEASGYARDLMQRWRTLVYQRSEAEFIPWFSSYWTRQWLTMKVTWYQLNAGGETGPVVDRLALYLQEQYQARVLEPVAKQVSPAWIMAQTTQLYVRLLREQLQGIAPRYGVPVEQFATHLQDIPAIALAPPASLDASLYQLVSAEPIDSQPAYVALVERLQQARAGPGAWSADAGISSLAKQTSESLVAERTRGVAGTVSSMVGRVAGTVISLGVAGFSALVRENERPKMEAQLRKNLNAAFDEEWLDLLRNPATGVLAGVNHMAGQIEGGLADSVMQPAHVEPLPPTVLVPGEPPRQDGQKDDETFYRLW
ncbi:hypothetical protein KRX52_06425 [Pseudomonas sp. MAP12]|uniref:Lipoprotein n=1 Tax=Geopseudomonas aromaticivorans TaxID=2849492 RepID=A0ABS6MUF7_9GAMM|nr:hypothetical protein [Pseudomonas aromaticivorans]MBV2132438.1 hypothetical protein [Pseudomonas aromaticivorans]